MEKMSREALRERCADDGNPDPSSTHGKKPDEAKQIELVGWDYRRRCAGSQRGFHARPW